MKRKCQDIMTKDPFCCEPSDTTQRAAQLMKVRHVGAVLVCDSQGTRHLVGIVTDRDLALRVVAEGLDPKITPVGDVMTEQVFICRPDDPVDKAIELMERYQVRRIPIVDDEGRIVGIITQGDIATRLNNPKKTAEVVTEISKPRMAA
jgi:CBS domain-containing protein